MPLIVPTKPDIERVVLLHNHTEEAVRLAWQCEEELRNSRLGKPVVRYMTKAGGREPNAELLDKILEPGDIIGTICGDGTFGHLAVSSGNTPITSLRGGNARDIGQALHQHRNDAPSQLIRDSVAVGAHAMSCAISSSGGTPKQEYAISYIGCGELGRSAEMLNSEEFRNMKHGVRRDLRIGLGALFSDFGFDLIDNEGEERRLSDLTFAKGPRMAKIGRFPVELWENRIRVTPIEEGVAAKAWAAVGMLAGRAAGLDYDQPYTFRPLSSVSMHFDGEPPVHVDPYSEVTVGLGAEWTALTSRLYVPS